jgi:hypothetical protein
MGFSLGAAAVPRKIRADDPLPPNLSTEWYRRRARDIAKAMLVPHQTMRLVLANRSRGLTPAHSRLRGQPLAIDWLTQCISVVDGRRTLRVLMPDDKFNVYTVIDLPIPDDCTPLEFLMGVMRHKPLPAIMRLDAAKNAAYYVHPRMMAVRVDEGGGKVELDIQGGLPPLPGTATIMPHGPAPAEPQRKGQWRKKKKPKPHGHGGVKG